MCIEYVQRFQHCLHRPVGKDLCDPILKKTGPCEGVTLGEYHIKQKGACPSCNAQNDDWYDVKNVAERKAREARVKADTSWEQSDRETKRSR